MKKFKVLSVVLVVAMLVATIAYADTFRLGSARYNFNPTNKVSKTAAYTLTASDSQVNVGCTNANITITLPTISSLRAGGSKAYKIVKTDSSEFTVNITPATGDTIGGESVRKLTYKNAYIIIGLGMNDDWHVSYESPYTVEDYEAASTTLYNDAWTVQADVRGAGNVATTSTTDVYVIAPKAGTLTSAGLSSHTSHDAAAVNLVIFSITNLGQAGANAEAMLASVAGNSTNATGGSNIVANTYWGFTLANTIGVRQVAANDTLRIRAAVNGTLHSQVLAPKYILKFKATQ